MGLGWVYGQEKMYVEAIAELEKAVSLSARHEDPWPAQAMSWLNREESGKPARMLSYIVRAAWLCWRWVSFRFR
jgi:hypothetical protein